MEWIKDNLTFKTNGKGMMKITAEIEALLRNFSVTEGLCYLFMPHVSASLAISEGYDPSSRSDVETFFERLAPEHKPWYRHTLEGSDDSPSHIRSVLTQPSLTLPVDDGSLTLGTWQEVFLFEHRAHPQTRRVNVRIMKVA